MKKSELINVLTSFSNKLAVKIESLFVKKEAGKGLSTNDFTDELKAKLNDIDPDSGVVVDSELNSDSINPVQNKVIVTALTDKANSVHGHAFSELTGTPTTLEGYGITDAETKGAANTALTSAKSYTDEKIAGLINGAPTTLDTLNEVADAMAANNDVVEALNDAVGTKANAADFTNVENKSSEMIRNEITAANVTTALGYTPAAEMEEITDSEIDAIIAGSFTE